MCLYRPKDILLTFLHLKHPCSRAFLVHGIGVGEGSMRSILDILKQKLLIESTITGHMLTRKGTTLYNQLLQSIDPPQNIRSTLYPDLLASAIVLKTQTPQSISLEPRDEAIRSGARAALILIHDQKLRAPGFDADFTDIEQQVDVKPHNIVIVAFSESQHIAQRAALAATMHISSQVQQLTKELQ